jgi:DNA-binding CsgD family transcriptional regulator
MEGSMRHAELHERAREWMWTPSTDRVQLLTELSLIRDETPAYDTLLEGSAEAIGEHYGAGCTISLLTDSRDAIHVIGAHHPEPGSKRELEALTAEPIPLLDRLEGVVVETGRARLLGLRAEDFKPRPQSMRYIEVSGSQYGAIVPLRARKEVTGILWMSSRTPFAEDDVHFLAEVAGRLGLLVEYMRVASGDVAPDTRPPAPGPAALLTERERDVLGLLALGMTSREVAERLVLSVRTVEWHRGRIQAKLGVSGRSALTRIANEAGLVPTDDR